MRKNNTDWKALYTGMCENYIELHARTKEDRTLHNMLVTLPESFTYMGVTYNRELEADPWGGCVCGSSSTCGTTFTVDKSGVIDRPNLPVGTYKVVVTKETDNL